TPTADSGSVKRDTTTPTRPADRALVRGWHGTRLCEGRAAPTGSITPFASLRKSAPRSRPRRSRRRRKDQVMPFAGLEADVLQPRQRGFRIALRDAPDTLRTIGCSRGLPP